MKRILPFFIFVLHLLCSCSHEDIPAELVDVKPEETIDKKTIYNIEALPTIDLQFSLEEWNKLLTYYDEDPGNKKFVKSDFKYTQDKVERQLTDIGVRIRGAWSRKRPEGVQNMLHVANETDWHHCSFALNFTKFVKDEDHELGGVKKIDLKYFNIDPSYVREIYIYDLLRRFGVKTAINASYCKLNIYVEGDETPAYFGIYMMMEHIDKNYLKDRTDLFGDAKGFLWKCEDATLADAGDDLFFIDDNSSEKHNYELKTNEEKFETGKREIQEFIRKFQGLQGEEFHNWITSVCDVELLLKTYAVLVACGDWDDYWNNCKNFYLYFNSEHKFFFIPFDLDNSLGICVAKYIAQDTGRADPFHWGREECKLISKLLMFSDFHEVYSKALKDLTNPDTHLFYYKDSAYRISQWWNLISDFIANDTGEHNILKDSPTVGTTHMEYRLLEDSPNNYFIVRSETINSYINQSHN